METFRQLINNSFVVLSVLEVTMRDGNPGSPRPRPPHPHRGVLEVTMRDGN